MFLVPSQRLYIPETANYDSLQVNDGVPVHFKGGAFDKALYGTTLLITGVGLVMMLEFFYTIINK